MEKNITHDEFKRVVQQMNVDFPDDTLEQREERINRFMRNQDETVATIEQPLDTIEVEPAPVVEMSIKRKPKTQQQSEE